MDTIQAGRELNILIAEKVFDWKRGHRYANGNGEMIRPDGSTTTWDSTPRYSSDIVAAIQVVDTFYRVRIEHRKDGAWVVGFWANEYGGIRRAEAPTLPHAICLAALKWM